MVLRRCAYCGAENLVGADVGLLARRAQRRSVALGALLLLEGRARAGQLAWIALGLAVAGYGALRAL